MYEVGELLARSVELRNVTLVCGKFKESASVMLTLPTGYRLSLCALVAFRDSKARRYLLRPIRITSRAHYSNSSKATKGLRDNNPTLVAAAMIPCVVCRSDKPTSTQQQLRNKDRTMTTASI